MKRGIRRVDAIAVSDTGRNNESCQVVEEDALTVEVVDVGSYLLMWTPTSEPGQSHGYTGEDGLLGDEAQPEALALALGFALSEGLINTLEDVRSAAFCEDDPGVIRVQLRHPEAVQAQRKNQVINSSCGLCGPREILDENALGLEAVAETLQLSATRFDDLMRQMGGQQRVFQQTGGSHAAAVFDSAGTLLAVAEDLGRHNALDKAIGLALLRRGDLTGCGAVLSSRLSLEMVLKAVRSGIEILLAVSAPTSLAIEVAQRFGVTLCGFVREGRATIYTHPQRIS